jgi:phosphoribosylformimino-5-aminoimidazole carboxamide ribotide isomerase
VALTLGSPAGGLHPEARIRVIPVLDLKRGRAVHARGGRRDRYDAVGSRLAQGRGDALALARAYRDALGLRELYVADLDAIAGGAPQLALVRSLTAPSVSLWLDAGTATPDRAQRLVREGVSRVVVGLETLPSFDALGAIVEAVGAGRVVFSLDLRDGRPLARAAELPALEAGRAAAIALAERAASAGAGTVIVLDLARVGTAAGVDLELVRHLRRALPRVELVAGGGVRDRADLEALADAGAHAALLATALHEGRLGKEDIEALRTP